MISYLKHMAVFARVVDEGSFRAAARAIGLAPSRISETVSELEDYLGATLLYRTTRKIALTNEGRIFHARVIEMLRCAETGLNELNALAIEPAGALKVSMPAFFVSSPFSRAMGEFVRSHPLVTLSITYTDQSVEPVGGGFDLVIRAGRMDDSSMMSRKLSEEKRVLVAGTDYASARPEPTHPKALEDWDWLGYARRGDTIDLISAQNEIIKIVGKSRLTVDNIEALYQFTRQNLGVTVLPRHLAERGLKQGVFVELLPEWKLRPVNFFAVWPDTSRRENLTLLLVRHLADKPDSA